MPVNKKNHLYKNIEVKNSSFAGERSLSDVVDDSEDEDLKEVKVTKQKVQKKPKKTNKTKKIKEWLIWSKKNPLKFLYLFSIIILLISSCAGVFTLYDFYKDQKQANIIVDNRIEFDWINPTIPTQEAYFEPSPDYPDDIATLKIVISDYINSNLKIEILPNQFDFIEYDVPSNFVVIELNSNSTKYKGIYRISILLKSRTLSTNLF